jgi:hypothetical protein
MDNVVNKGNTKSISTTEELIPTMKYVIDRMSVLSDQIAEVRYKIAAFEMDDSIQEISLTQLYVKLTDLLSQMGFMSEMVDKIEMEYSSEF